VPLQIADAGTDDSGEKVFRMVTQFTMKPVEQLGLLKMDFLGLAQPRRDRGRARHHRALPPASGRTWTTVPLDDPNTYEMMARGESVGVFQFESEGMRETLRKLGPSELEHLIALNAPLPAGSMENIPAYTRAKHNPESATYADERLRPILESTHGVVVYQEQAMQIAKEIAGFSGGEGGRPAQGDRKEEPRGDGEAEAGVLRGLPQVRDQRAGDRAAVDDERTVGRLIRSTSPTPPATR